MFFQFKSRFSDGNVLASFLALGLILKFDLVLLEDAQEALIIDACFLIFPELVHEVRKLAAVDFQLCADEHLLEVLTGDVASSTLVDDREEFRQVSQFAALDSLNQLVYDVLFLRVRLETKAFEFQREFPQADIFVVAHVEGVPENVDFILREAVSTTSVGKYFIE